MPIRDFLKIKLGYKGTLFESRLSTKKNVEKTAYLIATY